jgi:cytochrome c553
MGINVTDENREMYEVFCQMHPEEAYQGNPDEFIKYARKINPAYTKELIEELIKESNENKEYTEDELDLMQYITNMLYHVRQNSSSMDSPHFEKWVEDSIKDISEYYRRSPLTANEGMKDELIKAQRELIKLKESIPQSDFQNYAKPRRIENLRNRIKELESKLL